MTNVTVRPLVLGVFLVRPLKQPHRLVYRGFRSDVHGHSERPLLRLDTSRRTPTSRCRGEGDRT